MKIVLASASPRRRELLEQIGLPFEIKVSDVEERVTVSNPGQVVEELSRQKAEAVLAALERTAEDVLVIGADTVVALEGQILGKPSDSEDAARMLKGLSGRSHEVYTGVTLLYRPGIVYGPGTGAEDVAVPGKEGDSPNGNGACGKTFHERTQVDFYPLTDQEISDYVNSGECLDKAGAYGIQGIFARYVQGIQGDYNNVVGLPVGRLYQEAKEWLR